MYFRIGNLFETISNLEKAISLDPANAGRVNFMHLSQAYSWTGFDEKAKYFAEEELKWYNDTAKYHFSISLLNHLDGDYQSIIELGREVLEKNPFARNQLGDISISLHDGKSI